MYTGALPNDEKVTYHNNNDNNIEITDKIDEENKNETNTQDRRQLYHSIVPNPKSFKLYSDDIITNPTPFQPYEILLLIKTLYKTLFNIGKWLIVNVSL